MGGFPVGSGPPRILWGPPRGPLVVYIPLFLCANFYVFVCFQTFGGPPMPRGPVTKSRVSPPVTGPALNKYLLSTSTMAQEIYSLTSEHEEEEREQDKMARLSNFSNLRWVCLWHSISYSANNNGKLNQRHQWRANNIFLMMTGKIKWSRRLACKWF